MVHTDADDCEEEWLCSTEHLYITDESSDEEYDSENEGSLCGMEQSPPTVIPVPNIQSVPPENPKRVGAEPEMYSSSKLPDKVLNTKQLFDEDTLNSVNLRDISYDDVSDLCFEECEAAGRFYNYYAHVLGFSTRKSKIWRYRDNDLVRRRLWLCSKEGFNSSKKRNPLEEHEINEGMNTENKKRSRKTLRRGHRSSRCGCTAKFAVNWCKTRKMYFVSDFVTQHNHELIGPTEVQFLRSHRNVEEHDLAQVESLTEVQVSISRSYEFLAYQSGGYNNMRFTLKDLYNKLSGKRKAGSAEGDAQTAVRILRDRRSRETEFFFDHSVDTEGRLKNLFWRDHQSLLDYTAYGDVLVMDSTYKTNRYSQPLVLLVGCNNHRATVVFGIALVSDEKEETYDWVLNTFLVSMKQKKPVCVITDGDEAMKNVLERLMPETRHRLCAWHIGRNIGQNLNNEAAVKCFSKLIYASLTVPEWEAQWRVAIEEHQLQNDEWVYGLYKKRTRWAEAFFRGCFTGGMCSTQRCEGMNCQFKKHVDPTTSVKNMVERLEWKQRRLRDRVHRDNFDMKNSTPKFVTHMKELEKAACKTFSHDIFIMIQSQMHFENRFVVLHRLVFPNVQSVLFYVGQYERPKRRWSVEYRANKGNPLWFCSCKMYESDGIPCAHLFCVFKSELVTEFPHCLVNKRWTREVGDATIAPSCLLVPNNRSAKNARYASLLLEAGKACSRYAESPEGFNAAMIDLETLKSNSMKYNAGVNEHCAAPSESDAVVGDPLKSRTKGMPCSTQQSAGSQMKRSCITCSNCGGPGHNMRSCKKRPTVSDVCGSGSAAEVQLPDSEVQH